MAINPFKDTTLNDLQQNIREKLTEHFQGFSEYYRDLWKRFMEKGRERITLMFIPHSEKKIINFHISIFAISFFTGFIILTVTVTSILIVNHTSTIKEVSKLHRYGTNSKVQIQKYREEINTLNSIFQKFKPEITHLYSLTPGNTDSDPFAKGGIQNPEPPAGLNAENSPPPIEETLNLEAMEADLKATKEIIGEIKKFLEYRKKIISNTPSLWPVNGYIISRFGERNSPYSFMPEFHRGIDIEAFPGTEIKSTAPGIVNEIRWDPVLGLSVSIKHKYGFITSYSHCQRVAVERDQKISKGEVIGYVGNTGKTTRYICFYQIKIGTEFVDPMPYLNRIVK